MRWDPAKARKAFLFVPTFAASAGETVSDFDLLGSKVAHQPEPSNPSSCVPSQIHNQPVTFVEGVDSKVELMGEVNSDGAGEHVNFQIANLSWKFRTNDGFWRAQGMLAAVRSRDL